MTKTGQITRIHPAATIPGGEIVAEYDSISSETTRTLQFQINGVPAHAVGIGSRRALIVVPSIEAAEPAQISTVMAGTEVIASTEQLIVGRKIADGLHSVANPAFDPRDGSLFVTRSGSRGEHVPISIFRITSDGTLEDFSGDVMNPTAIAFDRLGRM